MLIGTFLREMMAMRPCLSISTDSLFDASCMPEAEWTKGLLLQCVAYGDFVTWQFGFLLQEYKACFAGGPDYQCGSGDGLGRKGF